MRDGSSFLLDVGDWLGLSAEATAKYEEVVPVCRAASKGEPLAPFTDGLVR